MPVTSNLPKSGREDDGFDRRSQSRSIRSTLRKEMVEGIFPSRWRVEGVCSFHSLFNIDSKLERRFLSALKNRVSTPKIG